MCGIAGIWNWGQKEIALKHLFAMAFAQKHRGPDGHGYAVWENSLPPFVWKGKNHLEPEIPVYYLRLGLAHNWLAIQDRNPEAQQPMSFADGRYWIVFNGEIYNFVELREELTKEGFHFSTNSDTEVLLALWSLKGPDSLSQLRGMFAFLIYDVQESVFWAVRDRFGIKPLYYSLLPDRSGILFSSEIRALHASGFVQRTWSREAVLAFLAAAVNKPDDEKTFFENVHEVPPGCFLEIRPERVQLKRHYRLPPINFPSLDIEAVPELRERFMESVSIHLRSSVEVGTCMSGGLDSTNIVCAIKRVLGEKISSFKAFTIGVPDSHDFSMAQTAAANLGLHHAVHSMPDSVQIPEMMDMIIACEIPNHTWGPINQYLLMRAISNNHGLRVLLDGQGGDETFSGYPWYVPILTSFLYDREGEKTAGAFRSAHQTRLPYPRRVIYTMYGMYTSRRRWIETFDDGASAALGVSPEEVLEWKPVQYYLNDELSWSDFRDVEFYRRELQHLLRQEDRLGMRFSIENRVPYLDHTFVEFVGNFHPMFLMHDGYLKYPLRELFPELPGELRFSTMKKGFWENYTTLPWLAEVVCKRISGSVILEEVVKHKKNLNRLGQMALWRFFQIAVLEKSYLNEESNLYER